MAGTSQEGLLMLETRLLALTRTPLALFRCLRSQPGGAAFGRRVALALALSGAMGGPWMTSSAIAAPDPQAYTKLIAVLNDDSTVKGTDDIKCYRVLFDAYLKL